MLITPNSWPPFCWWGLYMVAILNCTLSYLHKTRPLRSPLHISTHTWSQYTISTQSAQPTQPMIQLFFCSFLLQTRSQPSTQSKVNFYGQFYPRRNGIYQMSWKWGKLLDHARKHCLVSRVVYMTEFCMYHVVHCEYSLLRYTFTVCWHHNYTLILWENLFAPSQLTQVN